MVLEAPKRNFDRRGEIGTGEIILVDQTYQKQKSGTFPKKTPTFGVWLPVVDELRTFDGIADEFCTRSRE